jgi:hypothetical protein
LSSVGEFDDNQFGAEHLSEAVNPELLGMFAALGVEKLGNDMRIVKLTGEVNFLVEVGEAYEKNRLLLWLQLVGWLHQ